MRTPSRRLLVELVVFGGVLIGWMILMAVLPSRRPAPTGGIIVSRPGSPDLPCTQLYTNPQGLLVVKTVSGTWALVGPTGQLLVWIHDPEMISYLERQAGVEPSTKVFRQ